MKKIWQLFIVVLLVLAIAACGSKKDDPKPAPDTEIPVIIPEKPIDYQEIGKGKPLALKATVKDNEALEECVVTIEYNEQQALKSVKMPWAPATNGVKHTVKLNGTKEFQINEEQLFGELIEPSCLEGEYTLKLMVKDKAQNTATKSILITIR